jgi:hypothetical protein
MIDVNFLKLGRCEDGSHIPRMADCYGPRLGEVNVPIAMEVGQSCGNDPAGEAGIDCSERGEACKNRSRNPVKGR